MTETMTEPNTGSRWPLLLMAAIFAIPLIAAWFYWLHPEQLPQTRSNKGEILNPVVELPVDMALMTPSGDAFDRSTLTNAWTLVYLDQGICGPACLERLTQLRQIRLGLGEAQVHVERLYLVHGASDALEMETMDRAFDGMHIALTDDAGAGMLADALGEDTDRVFGRIYICDPMGRLMMRYGADAPPTDTLSDMERLLKASKNWIKGKSYGHN